MGGQEKALAAEDFIPDLVHHRRARSGFADMLFTTHWGRGRRHRDHLCQVREATAPPGFAAEPLQDLFDAVVLLDRLVEHPGELGHTFELQPAADVPPQERRGALQRPGRVLPRFRVADRGVEHARLLQVGRDLDVGDGEEADARVVDLAGEQFGELSPDLVADTGGSGSLRHEFLK